MSFDNFLSEVMELKQDLMELKLNNYDDFSIKQLIEKYDIVLIGTKKNSFNTTEFTHSLKRKYPETTSNDVVRFSEQLAEKGLAHLITYLNVSDKSFAGYQVELFDFSK